MRVPTRSAGTRSGVNWRRLKLPPSTSATVLTVSVLARPGTPSSSTWPPARSATSTRSSIASWPTITRLISNSACSSAWCASRAGLGSSSSRPSARRRRSSAVTPSSPVLGVADLVRLLAELHGEGTPFAAPLNDHAYLVVRTPGVDGGRDVVGLVYRGTRDLDDPVALAQAGLGGRAARDDRADARSTG